MVTVRSLRPGAFLRVRLFRPILTGATLRDRLLACVGALAGILLTGLVCGLAATDVTELLWLVPPMGASAVLLFAVPSSPMAQPWPAIGGNVVSAAVGVVIAHHWHASALTAGVAVAVAIGIMSLLRCLHPPGGAAALVGLFAGASTSYAFPLLPVGLNAVLLVTSAWVYHRFSGHAYPHVAAPAGTEELPWTFSKADVTAAVDDIGEAFDVDADDLVRLLRQVERRAVRRSYGELTCADLMSGVVPVHRSASPAEARTLVLEHDVRRLPVLNDQGQVVGSIGLRELATQDGTVAELMSVATMAAPDRPVIDLLGHYAHERVRAVFVVDQLRRPIGVVTEADWLAVLARGLD
jgi:CBS domain-containing membrane protein